MGETELNTRTDVCLIQASSYNPAVEKTQPLGLMYLASYLRNHGYAPAITDMKVHDLRVGQVLDQYRQNPCDLVGIGAITLDSVAAHEVAAGIKRINPDAFVVLGGAHATAYYEDVLADFNIDAVVCYEGEETFRHLLDARREGLPLEDVPGIAFRKNGSVTLSPARPSIEDIDSLPFPAWDLIDVEMYWKKPRIAWIYKAREYMCVTTSRGCPYRCKYCHRTLGKTWRARSVENTIEEMRRLRHDYNIREIVIVDDTFNLSKTRTREFAEKLIEADLNLHLHFPVGFRGDLLEEETVALLKRAGMYRCMIAIETASDRVQKLIDKNLDVEKVRRIVSKVSAMGVMTHGVFMLGFPTETRQEMEATMNFALKSDFHSMAVSIAIPFKNSGLIDLAKEDGITFDDKFDRYSFTRSDVNLSRVPIEWILSLRRRTYRRFFSPARIYRFLRLLPHPHIHLWTLAKVFVRKAFFW